MTAPEKTAPVRRHWFNTNAWRRINYTLWAPIYDPLVQFAFKSRRRRSMALLAPKTGERLLIVGAGTGLDLDYLPRGMEVTAVDLTPAMVRRLQRRAARLDLPVDARVMDAHALAFPDHLFDLVILHLILAVIPDPVRCMHEAARVLKPGGRAVILDKFVPDRMRPPLMVRLLNPLFGAGGTEITRQLGPILAAAPVRILHQETMGFGGMVNIVLIERLPGETVPREPAPPAES